MSSLVGYGSSDDEEYEGIERVGLPEASISASSPGSGSPEERARDTFLTTLDTTNAEKDGVQESEQEAKVFHNTLVGPLVQPADRSNSEDGWTTPMSPYSANRAATRNLTMPLLPNLDIPPSPPGSPPPGMEEKFERFLQLKKQGVHFNDKLAGSSALKNPMLLQKLMASAGLSESDQYATALPEDLWDPSAFPNHAYKEELARSQQQITKRKEEENLRKQREKVDFVPTADAERSFRGDGTTSMFGGKGNRDSAAERVATSLGEQTSQYPRGPAGRLRGELERRSGRRTDS
ncbi:MAG: hypothetical protein Q9188_000575 [Gyalolechia gomerana]